MARKWISVPALLALMVLAVSPLVEGSHADARVDRPQIVASFSILADVAQNVAGDAADVTSLIPFGGDPHSYSPSARDVAALSDADAVLAVGINFEESLLPVIQEAASDQLVIVSACVPVRAIEAGMGAHEDDHADEATAEAHLADQGAVSDAVAQACAQHTSEVAAAFGVDDAALSEGAIGPLYALECPGDAHDEAEAGADDEAHEHAAGSCDPHVWTDPANAALWALSVRDTLSSLDPANAETYAANADAYLSELAALDGDVRDQIATIPEARRLIVTNHLTLSYYAHRYGLELAGVVIPGGGTAAEPSVQEVLDLVSTVQDYGVPAIFTETTVNPSLAQQVADETGAQIVPLYTDSLSEPDGDAGTYLDYIRYDTRMFVEALSQ